MKTTTKPRIVEICGMPGAGKSTVYGRMQEGTMNAQFGYRLSRFRNCIDIVVALVTLSPMFVRLGFGELLVYRLKFIPYLKVLHKAINCQDVSSKRLMVFDQGPLFRQVFLLAIASSYRPQECLKSWIARNVSDWSGTLNGIVWLDADDATLLERVRHRNKTHWLKTRTAEERREFMDGFRSAYDEVISMYEQKGVSVLRLSTTEDDVDVTVNRIGQFVSEMESPTR